MKLYHGTNGRYIQRILSQGIRPRGGRKHNNWKHTVSSNPHATYLTIAYPLHFVFNSTNGSGTGAVFEVESDLLDKFMLLPDEDVLAQADQLGNLHGSTLFERTKWYRKHLAQWMDGHSWTKSLEIMGTCCHLGTIPPEAITRYVKFSIKKNMGLAWQFDPSISIINFHILGPMYRASTVALFGDEPNDELKLVLEANPELYRDWKPRLKGGVVKDLTT